VRDPRKKKIKIENEVVALCRCGGSKKKPFCDGTHQTIGFKD
ncbi:MAG: CDGSH iron-sulfur domain-containing protein, partial [Bacteroidales bacterium]